MTKNSGMREGALAPIRDNLNVAHAALCTPSHSEDISGCASFACSRVTIIFKYEGIHRDEMDDLNWPQQAD